MRDESRSSIETKPGANQARANTSAVNPTRMRVSPGIPRKPKRRSSLSRQVMIWARVAQASRLRNKTDRRLEACATFCRRLACPRESGRAKNHTAVRRACATRRENYFVRWLAHAGAIHEHPRGTIGGAEHRP